MTERSVGGGPRRVSVSGSGGSTRLEMLDATFSAALTDVDASPRARSWIDLHGDALVAFTEDTLKARCFAFRLTEAGCAT